MPLYCPCLQETTNKWVSILGMRYVILNRYNVVLVWLSLKKSITTFLLRNQPPSNNISIKHVCRNNFVWVLKNDYDLMLIKCIKLIFNIN